MKLSAKQIGEKILEALEEDEVANNELQKDIESLKKAEENVERIRRRINEKTSGLISRRVDSKLSEAVQKIVASYKAQ